jgi:YegS/Rv2252/BmrU family lipid kinase
VPKRTLVIVNPRSRSGATGRRWDAVERKLRDALGPIEVEQTRAPRDATRIAREGARAGVGRMIVAGGDGTLSEVTTGLLAADLGGYTEIGPLPLGTGGDFVRTLGIPRDTDAAIACLAAGRSRRVDAGRVTYLAGDSREDTVYFVNVTSFGISGLSAELASRTTNAFGGTAAFLIGTIRSIARYRSEKVSVRVDGELIYEDRFVLATAANGRYFGGGMLVAPQARPDDGLLDVVVISDLGKHRLLAKLPSIYRGGHLRDPAVQFHRGRRVEADASPGTVPLEIDGEPLGTLPATIEILPGALSFLCAAW